MKENTFKADKASLPTSSYPSYTVSYSPPSPNGHNLFTIKFGALTSWLKDVSIIVLAWKAISYLSSIR